MRPLKLPPPQIDMKAARSGQGVEGIDISSEGQPAQLEAEAGANQLKDKDQSGSGKSSSEPRYTQEVGPPASPEQLSD